MEQSKYIPPGDQWMMENPRPGDRRERDRHIFPQRMHDLEKSYSPSLKTLGGYSYEPSKENEQSDSRKKEYCERYEKIYNELINLYEDDKLGITLDELNGQIEMMNETLESFGCPFPPYKPPMPVITLNRQK